MDHRNTMTPGCWRAAAVRWLGRLLASVVLSSPLLSGAEQTRVEGIPDPGHGWARHWIDVNGDGRDDFCTLTGGSAETLRCHLSTANGFNAVEMAYSVGASTLGNALYWVDVNGDGRIDLCRFYVATPSSTSGTMGCRLG